MKLKGIFASLLAVLAFATACQKEADHYLDNIKVDQSYVGISPEGGSQTINLTATGSWTAASKVDWITITPASGSAGATTLTITASAAEETRETTIAIECDGQTQNINVIQQAEKTERPVSTIAEVIAAGAGSFRVRGTVTKVANEQYGNFYVEDETGSIYIYGVKDSQGYPKDGKGGWARFGIEVGDIVTVEGPYTLYGSTHELVDAEVIKVEKSLIQIAPFDFTELPATDTTFTLKIDSKVNPILANIDADWLSFTGVNADGSYQLHAAANPRTAKRTATISFKGPGAQASTTVTQAGIPATGPLKEMVAERLAVRGFAAA